MKHADGSVTLTFKVAFGRGPRVQKRAAVAPPAPGPEPPAPLQFVAPPPPDASKIPKITRMLVLGYHFEQLVREGKVKNYAEIATRTGLSRARVTQIINLTILPPSLQATLLQQSDELSHDRNLRQLPATWPARFLTVSDLDQSPITRTFSGIRCSSSSATPIERPNNKGILEVAPPKVTAVRIPSQSGQAVSRYLADDRSLEDG